MLNKSQKVKMVGGMIDKTDVYEAAFILACNLLYGQSMRFLFSS